MAITRFRDEYFFLSNFYPHELKFHGMTFLNSEAAFQAMKTQDIAEQLRFTLLTPQEAKRLGRRIDLFFIVQTDTHVFLDDRQLKFDGF